jgi:hypothetical protein
MEIDGQGNIYITGNFSSNSFSTGGGGILTTTSNGSNTFLIKIFAINGNVLWARAFQGTNSTNSTSGRGLDIDNSDNVILTGDFRGTIDLDPSNAVVNRTFH